MFVKEGKIRRIYRGPSASGPLQPSLIEIGAGHPIAYVPKSNGPIRAYKGFTSPQEAWMRASQAPDDSPVTERCSHRYGPLLQQGRGHTQYAKILAPRTHFSIKQECNGKLHSRLRRRYPTTYVFLRQETDLHRQGNLYKQASGQTTRRLGHTRRQRHKRGILKHTQRKKRETGRRKQKLIEGSQLHRSITSQ